MAKGPGAALLLLGAGGLLLAMGGKKKKVGPALPPPPVEPNPPPETSESDIPKSESETPLPGQDCLALGPGPTGMGYQWDEAQKKCVPRPKPTPQGPDPDVMANLRESRGDLTKVPADFGHESLWISDDCETWAMGRDYVPILTIEGVTYKPDEFYIKYGKGFKPSHSPGFPDPAIASHYSKQLIMTINGLCGQYIPSPNNYGSEDEYNTARDAFYVERPNLGALFKTMFYLVLDKENQFGWGMWKEYQKTENYELEVELDWAKWAIEEFGPQADLAKLTNEAYWKVYEGVCPVKLPKKSEASPSELECIDAWNRLLKTINDLRNAGYGA